MLRGSSESIKTSVTPLPVATDEGRADVHHEALYTALIVACLVAGGILWIIAIAFGPHEFESFTSIGRWRQAGQWACGGAGSFLFVFGFYRGYRFIRAGHRWDAYLEKVRDQDLENRRAQPVVTEIVRNKWELTVADPGDIVKVAVWSMYEYLHDGTVPTVNGLSDDGLRFGAAAWLLGRMNRSQAERMRIALLELGLMHDRGERQRALWVPQTWNEFFALLDRNAQRVGSTDKRKALQPRIVDMEEE